MVKRSSSFWLLAAAFPQSAAVQICWFGIYTFVNAYLIKGLGFTKVDWTAATLWFTGGMIVWPFISLEIASRLGRRATVVLSVVVAGLFYLAMAFTQSLWLINLLLLLASFTVATSTAVWLPLVAEVGREAPGRSLALVQFIAAGIGAVLLVAGGFLIDLLGYRGTFVLIGGLCLACAALFSVMTGKLEETHAGSEVVSFRHFTRQDLKGLSTGPLLLLLLLGTGTEPFNYLTVNQLFPNLAWEYHGLDNRAVGFIVGLGRLPALLSLFLIARVVDRMNAVMGYGLGIAIVGIFVTLLGSTGQTDLFIGVYALYFLFQGCVWGTSVPAINATVAPRLRDSAFAVLGVISTVALFVMGVIHNRMIAAGISLPRLFVLCGICALVGGIILAMTSLRRKTRLMQKAEAEIPA